MADTENREAAQEMQAVPKYRFCIICGADMVYNPEDGLWHCSNPDCWWVDAD